MFASLFHKTNRKSPARMARLDVETLEGRALMSTLAVLAAPSLAPRWPQEEIPTVVSISGTRRAGEEVPALCGGPRGGVDMDTVLLGGFRPDSDAAAGAYDDVLVAGTRRAGEEVPALCGGPRGGVDMDTVLSGFRPGSDVAAITAVHATGGANDVVLLGKAGGGGVEV